MKASSINHSSHHQCPACLSEAHEKLLHLESVPVHVGLLWTTPEDAKSCPKGEIELTLCTSCGYTWNSAYDGNLLGYAQDYDNALHHSPKFAAWEQELSDSLIKRHHLKGRRLAEIGCGDGRFLSILAKNGGNTGIGFEPGHNPDRVSKLVASANVEIIDAYVDAFSLQGYDVDFALARHVLEHVPQPSMLLSAIRHGVSEGGGAYLEVPNFSWALERGAFEDLMYEHCGYYTPETLSLLLRRSGFSDVSVSSTFDGLFVGAEATVRNGTPTSENIDPIVVEAIRDGVSAFGGQISRASSKLESRRASGQKVIAWGGGARAVGLLNLVSNAEVIDSVVDVNPRKQGTFVTGTGHPIVPPDHLIEAQPDAILVVNPIYRIEIQDMLTNLDVHADIITFGND